MKQPIRRVGLVGCGACFFLLGLIIAKFANPALFWPLLVGIVSFPLVLMRRPSGLFVLVLLGMSIGLWRGQSIQNQLALYDALRHSEVALTGVIVDSSGYTDKGEHEFFLKNVQADDGQHLPGKIRIRTFALGGALRGDRVSVAGKLRDGFGNYQAAVYYADIEILTRDNGWLERFRRNFFAVIHSVVPEPQASLGLGFLVGARSDIPEGLKEGLKIAGLTHIIAVSGYNLTIITQFVRRVMAKRSAFQAVAWSIALIWVFVLITGASPSITRAAVVSVLSLTAWYFGHKFNPFALILLSAAITAWFDPLSLWFDIGWWLSFSAFFGILVVAPLITRRFKKKQPHFLGAVAIETISAQVMALPIIALVFGETSLISFFANILIVPLVPFAMMLTAIAGIGGILMPALAGWVSWPATLLLSCITSAVSVLSRLPGTVVQGHLSMTQLTVAYAIIAFGLLMLWQKGSNTLARRSSTLPAKGKKSYTLNYVRPQ